MTNMDAMQDQELDATMATSNTSPVSVSPKSPQAFGGRRTKVPKPYITSPDTSQSPMETQGGRSSGRTKPEEVVEEDVERQDRRAQLDQDLNIFGFNFRRRKAKNSKAAPFKTVARSSMETAPQEQTLAPGNIGDHSEEEQAIVSPDKPVDANRPSSLQMETGMWTERKPTSSKETNDTVMTVDESASDLQAKDHGQQDIQQQQVESEQMEQDADNEMSPKTTAATTASEHQHQLIWRGSWIAPSLIVLRESSFTESKKRTTSSRSLSRKQIDLQQRNSMVKDTLAQEGLQPLVQELKGLAMILSGYRSSDGQMSASASLDQPLVADGTMEMHVIAKIELLTFPSYLLDIHHQYGAYEVYVSSNSTDTVNYLQGVFGDVDLDGINKSSDTPQALLGNKGLLVRAVEKPQTGALGRLGSSTSKELHSANDSHASVIKGSQMFLVYSLLGTSSSNMACGDGTISLYAYPLVDHAHFSAQSLYNQPVMERLEAEYMEQQQRRWECLHQQTEDKKLESPEPSDLVDLDDLEIDMILNGAQDLNLSNKPPSLMDIDEDESKWEEMLLLEAFERNKTWKPYTVLPPSIQANPGTPVTTTNTTGSGSHPSRHTALDSMTSLGVGAKRAFSRSQTMVVAGSESSTASASGTFSRHQSLDSHSSHRRKRGDVLHTSSGGNSSARRTRESGSSGRDKITEALRMRLLGPGSIRKSSDQGRLSLPPAASRSSLLDKGKEPLSPNKRRQSTGTHRKTSTPRTPTGRPTAINLTEMLLSQQDDDDDDSDGLLGFQGLSRSILTSPSARARRRVTMGPEQLLSTSQPSFGSGSSSNSESSSRRKSSTPSRISTTTLSRGKSNDDNPFWTRPTAVAPDSPPHSPSTTSQKASDELSTTEWLSRASDGDDADGCGDGDDHDHYTEDQIGDNTADAPVSTSPVKPLFVYDRQENKPGNQRDIQKRIDTPSIRTTDSEGAPTTKPKTKSIKEQNENTIKSLMVATLSKHNVHEDQQDYDQCAQMLLTSATFAMRRDIDTKLYTLHEVEKIMDRAAALL
ncbi:hypothetical protein BGW41_005972 [Actinomortierella wolfii]|nr:hypothetical protein BGW41_005972 [Actinomortierella wolfii]